MVVAIMYHATFLLLQCYKYKREKRRCYKLLHRCYNYFRIATFSFALKIRML